MVEMKYEPVVMATTHKGTRQRTLDEFSVIIFAYGMVYDLGSVKLFRKNSLFQYKI